MAYRRIYWCGPNHKNDLDNIVNATAMSRKYDGNRQFPIISNPITLAMWPFPNIITLSFSLSSILHVGFDLWIMIFRIV